MDKIKPLQYYADRVIGQFTYMYEITVSDRTKERKEELLQSATDMLGVITKEAPKEYQFELVFIVAASAIEYANRCLQHNRKPLPGTEHSGGIEFNPHLPMGPKPKLKRGYTHTLKIPVNKNNDDAFIANILNKGSLHVGLTDKDGKTEWHHLLPKTPDQPGYQYAQHPEPKSVCTCVPGAIGMCHHCLTKEL